MTCTVQTTNNLYYSLIVPDAIYAGETSEFAEGRQEKTECILEWLPQDYIVSFSRKPHKIGLFKDWPWTTEWNDWHDEVEKWFSHVLSKDNVRYLKHLYKKRLH